MAAAAAASEGSKSYVLATGGAGFIGSHTAVELLNAGYSVVVADNLDNASEESLVRVRKITGCKDGDLVFEKIDMCDVEAMEKLFTTYVFSAVIHFAGKKAVGESVSMPLTYYQNNITGSLVLMEAMKKHGCKNLVFSSSATVYGEPEKLPITEECALSATNPYGRTKLFLEEIMRDLYISDDEWNILLLRYFNPVGAHVSGMIGEDPAGIPNNLMPFIAQVASGKRECLSVFGDDWDTKDGTGVRDYIHVVDLAVGHVAALKKLGEKPGCVAVNLGTGEAYSVLEMLAALGKACGKVLPHKICPRRPGDIAACYCDPAFAKSFLGWEATRGCEEMCADLWRWQLQNPDGFPK
eukprot:COSAG01_NODE_8655_length_2706_cov_12.197929_2_plen_353_part_00